MSWLSRLRAHPAAGGGAGPSPALPAWAWLAALSPAFVALAVDLAVRFHELTLFQAPQYLNYGAGALYEGLLVAVGFALLRRTAYAAALLAFGAGVWSLAQGVMYAHHVYFGTLPNIFMLNLLLRNTAEAVSLMWAAVTPWHVAALVALLGLNLGAGWLALRHGVRLRRRVLAGLAALLLAAGFVINHNFPIYPGSFPGVTYALYQSKFFVQTLDGEKVRWLRKGHRQRTYTVGPPPPAAAAQSAQAPRWNVLLLLGESVRASDLSYYGYERDTAPYVTSLIRAGRVLPFQRHLAVSNATVNNVPLMYSGVFPPGEHQVPFVYDYLKHWGGVTTFIISSQGMLIDQSRLMYGTSLDHFMFRESADLPVHSSMGADDAAMVPLVLEHLKTVNQPFFGVVQFNNTHFPYTPSSSTGPFGGADPGPRDRYHNAMIEHDALIRGYLDALQALGLLDSTLVLFTSDHGEAFGEHDHFGHLQTLYNEELWVPLWWHIPPGFPAEQRAALTRNAVRNTSHLDLLPTVLDLFGLWSPQHLTLPVSGASLLRDADPARPLPQIGYGLKRVRGVVMGDLKLIETVDERKTRHELYNWVSDRAELRNLWHELPPGEQRRWLDTLARQFGGQPGGRLAGN